MEERFMKRIKIILLLILTTALFVSDTSVVRATDREGAVSGLMDEFRTGTKCSAVSVDRINDKGIYRISRP